MCREPIHRHNWNGLQISARCRWLFKQNLLIVRHFTVPSTSIHPEYRSIGQIAVGEVDSWSTGEQYAYELLLSRGLPKELCHGWTVSLDENDDEIELMGYDYVLDLICELEIPPCSPVCKSFFLVHDGRDRSSKSRRRRHHRTTLR